MFRAKLSSRSLHCGPASNHAHHLYFLLPYLPEFLQLNSTTTCLVPHTFLDRRHSATRQSSGAQSVLTTLVQADFPKPASSNPRLHGLLAFSEDLQEYSGVALESVRVQGGALALLSLRQSLPLAGVLSMSGYLTLADDPLLSEANKGTPLLMCHGDADPVVSASTATQLQSTKRVSVKDGHAKGLLPFSWQIDQSFRCQHFEGRLSTPLH